MRRYFLRLLPFLPLAALLLAACEGDFAAPDTVPAAFRTPTATLLPAYIQTPQAAQAEAQATLAAGQGQLMELALQATQVNMAMTQAASTEQALQRQTQEAIAATDAQIERWRQGTQRAAFVTATAASAQATGTQATWDAERTRTAEALALLNTQAASTQNAQATLDQAALYTRQTQQAYPPTQTAAVATQTAINRAIEQAEREAFWRQFVTPLLVALPVGVVIIVILLIVAAYRRLMPVIELRARTFVGRDGDIYTFLPGEKPGKSKQPDNANLTMVAPKRSFGPVVTISPQGGQLSGIPENPQFQENTTARTQMAATVGLLTDAAARSAWAEAFGRLFGRNGRSERRYPDSLYREAQRQTANALQAGAPRRVLPQGYTILPANYPTERIIPAEDQSVIEAEWREVNGG